MSRADTVRNILVLEEFAAQARKLAAEHRAALLAEAAAELAEHGTAPTWRMPDVATISLSISKGAIVVSDPDALKAWVAHRNPSEIETVLTTKVRASFVNALTSQLVAEDGMVIDPATGEIVPGLTAQEGGRAGSLSIRAEHGVKAVVGSAVTEMLGTARAAIAPPAPVEPSAFDDPWSSGGDPFAVFPPAEQDPAVQS